MQQTQHDLSRDLKICELATPEPWCVDVSSLDVFSRDKSGKIIAKCSKIEDACFIIAARTAWPHTIQRAIEAEKRVAELEAENERLRKQLRDLNEYKRLAEWGLRKVFGEERGS